MSEIYLKSAPKVLEGKIKLPSSKSESNRALMIQALARRQSGSIVQIANLSQARDTRTMQTLLSSPEPVLDVIDAGTTMRFLTAYFAITQENKILTGTPRMCERPIKILVDALRSLGAEIDYLQKEGYPPIKLNTSVEPNKVAAGFQQKTKELRIRGDVSSQYISALLMIAPLLPQGLVLHLEGSLVSRPYIQMTLQQMQSCGIVFTWEGQTIQIEPQIYASRVLDIESDWSAASYWYSFAALASSANLTLANLKAHSLQGDSHILSIMADLGLASTFTPEGVELRKTAEVPKVELHLDFNPCPDLAQTVITLAAAKHYRLLARGLETLRIKETDRILALQQEFRKFGVELKEEPGGYWALLYDQWAAAPDTKAAELHIETYHDHRMAMAFAPLVFQKPLYIKNPEVVDKSYPHFWEDLRQVGFELERRS